MKNSNIALALFFLSAFFGSGCATRTVPSGVRPDAGLKDFGGIYANVGEPLAGAERGATYSLWYILTKAKARAHAFPVPEEQDIVSLVPLDNDQLIVQLHDRDGGVVVSEVVRVRNMNGSLRLSGKWFFPVIAVSHRRITLYITRDGDCVVSDDMCAVSMATAYEHHRHVLYRRKELQTEYLNDHKAN